jgi:aryl-alcohol dehydrogenase-like predicted oxidoreductase
MILQWTLRQPGIGFVLAGARNATQAIENAKSVDLCMTGADIKFINEKFEKSLMV